MDEGETGKAPNPTNQPVSRTLGDTRTYWNFPREVTDPPQLHVESASPPTHREPLGPQASREMLMAPAPSRITNVSLVSPGADSPAH